MYSADENINFIFVAEKMNTARKTVIKENFSTLYHQLHISDIYEAEIFKMQKIKKLINEKFSVCVNINHIDVNIIEVIV